KKILGLDLGTNSIGWAVVNEAENENETSSIIKLGVRVNPLTVDEQTNFEKGKSITTNADRTLKRSMRRNLQRYKLRRENLIEILKANGFISDTTILSENGNRTTFETYRLRAKAATEQISLEELARVLLMINKKRGYKSSRKAKSNDEGQLIDGMSVAKEMYDNHLTPGQYVYNRLQQGKMLVPDFYRSDLKAEFDRIWNVQRQFYPELLTDELKEKLEGKNKTQTWAICKDPWGLVGIKRETKGNDLKKENYLWRCNALSQKLELESLAIVLQEINGQASASSGYLGNISDRSKNLYFNHLTVGQYQMQELDENPNHSLKNEVFYRQDYLDEFEKIWETQAQYHPELTEELKKDIRDVVIFYQRRLKSQKGLISICEFEGKEIVVNGKKILTGPKVCPKSSPLFQEFKIWQILNNITVKSTGSRRKTKRTNDLDLFAGTADEDFVNGRYLNEDEKKLLFKELQTREKMSSNDVIKLLFNNDKSLELNFDSVEGNHTMAALIAACASIIEYSGHDAVDFSKMSADKTIETIKQIFDGLGFKSDFLSFDALLDGKAFEQQTLFRLWHLLYSFEGDNSATGDENLVQKISELCNMPTEYARIIANITFKDDYSSLSAKAIRKIMPYLQDGNEFSVACGYAGYRHSKESLTKEEIVNKVLKNKLDILPKNSLRNPVVEKILNQMVHVVNGVMDAYGKPDE
ncbi:MAG: type II CRISPR RNA-guided endonuclease Cas9, partial [Fibrobacter sp.]|nr:type II CRISPR RNA-guided endonuclease Cas9 [Fibrobacter sp.]